MKKFWSKFKLFWKELGNFLTNLLCPVVSALASGAALLQLPAGVIQFLKKVEYWCFYACSTKPVIDELVEKVDEVITKEKGEK